MTCIGGVKWPCAPCAKCRAWVKRLAQEFERDVFFGTFDRDVYAPSDKRSKNGLRD